MDVNCRGPLFSDHRDPNVASPNPVAVYLGATAEQNVFGLIDGTLLFLRYDKLVWFRLPLYNCLCNDN